MGNLPYSNRILTTVAEQAYCRLKAFRLLVLQGCFDAGWRKRAEKKIAKIFFTVCFSCSFGILLSSFRNTPKAKRELVLRQAHRACRPKAWRTGGGQMLEGRNVFGIASRLSRAKIKCSICSSQFNTWDAQHRWALVLIVCLNRGRRFKARFVAPTGCPGIAVPPGSAHARPWRVSIA